MTTPEPYDPRHEPAPEEPFFSPSFQRILCSSLAIANETAIAINSCARVLRDRGPLVELSEDAAALSSFQGSEKRTIAILGDSGEGKSSLINSLLNYPELAKTGDIGSACTSVITEYRRARPYQTANIILEVEFLSAAQIADLIKELLWNFRKFYLPDVERKKVSASDYTRWQKESEQAWSALESAFKHRPLFSKNYLNDTSNGASERITGQLVSWTSEIQWPEGSADGIWSTTADDAEQCCEKTSLFTRDQFWPFTKIIRIFLDAQILNTGVVLADLPGLHDTNLARVRTTQEYLMKCDLFLIVANISRAITNQSLKSSLHTVLSRHMPLEWEDESSRRKPNFAFVCTMAENLNIETEKRDFCGTGKPISVAKMCQLENEIEEAKQEGNRILKKELKRRREVMLANARNNYVRSGLKEVYSTHVSGGCLEVFCVSNAWYKKYVRKGDASMVKASGIPDLRRFCRTITAEAQLLEAQNFMQAKVQRLLTSTNIWTTNHLTKVRQPSGPSPQDLQVLFQDVLVRILGNIRGAQSNIVDTFNDTLSQYFSKRDKHWVCDARTRHEKWTNWHWTQYNAWCMNNGKHATEKQSFVDWNAEIIWKMRSELAYEWEVLEEEIPSCFEQLLTQTEEVFQRLKRPVQSHQPSNLVSAGVDFQTRNLQYHTALLQTEFLREVARIRRWTFEPCGNSYILGEMIPAYRAAAGEVGTGKANRQQRHIESKIKGGALFPSIAFRIRSSMEPVIDETFSDIEKLFRQSFELIKTDVSTAFSSQEPQITAADEEEADAVKQLAASIDALRKRHTIALKEIESL